MIKNKDRIQYTLAHRKAFRKIEKELLGYNTFRSLFHDLDKVFLYPFFDYKKVHNFHRNHAHHHTVKAKTRNDYEGDKGYDYLGMVIDWECARYTKPDKPLNVRQTLYKFYPEIEDKILPLLEEFHL